MSIYIYIHSRRRLRPSPLRAERKESNNKEKTVRFDVERRRRHRWSWTDRKAPDWLMFATTWAVVIFIKTDGFQLVCRGLLIGRRRAAGLFKAHSEQLNKLTWIVSIRSRCRPVTTYRGTKQNARHNNDNKTTANPFDGKTSTDTTDKVDNISKLLRRLISLR